jgi:hypothetical protein
MFLGREIQRGHSVRDSDLMNLGNSRENLLQFRDAILDLLDILM